MTEGTIAAPPSASCGSIFRFSSSKKPLSTPRYSGATSAIGITPTLSVVASAVSAPPPPPPPPSPSSPHAATSAAHAIASTSARPMRPFLISVLLLDDRISGITAEPPQLHQTI
jgi:hypothetical protein